jgi:hypothetical protein
LIVSTFKFVVVIVLGVIVVASKVPFVTPKPPKLYSNPPLVAGSQLEPS